MGWAHCRFFQDLGQGSSFSLQFLSKFNMVGENCKGSLGTMNRFILLTLLLMLSGCGSMSYWSDEEEVVTIPSADPYVQKTVMTQVAPYSLELKSLYNVVLQRSNIENRDGELLVWLDFETMDIMTIDDARDLVVNLTEGLLLRLNQQQVLRDLTSNGEVTEYNLFINIRFDSFFAVHIDPLYLGRLVLDEGEVFYYAQTGTYRGRDLKVHHHHRELYLVSKEIISLEMEVKRNQIRSRVDTLKEEAKRRRLIDEQKRGG